MTITYFHPFSYAVPLFSAYACQKEKYMPFISEWNIGEVTASLLTSEKAGTEITVFTIILIQIINCKVLSREKNLCFYLY